MLKIDSVIEVKNFLKKYPHIDIETIITKIIFLAWL